MALEECGIFFLCSKCYEYRQQKVSFFRPHHHKMRWVNGSQRTKPREDKLPEDASVEYAPEKGANMALADGISTPIETERQQTSDHKLKDSERKFVTVKRKKRKKRAKEECKTS